MALTNYVGQSVISMFIFRSVGLGLGARIGPAFYLPLGVGIYATQLVISRFWLRHFHFGPLEWVWRMLTYGSRVPLVKRRHDGAALATQARRAGARVMGESHRRGRSSTDGDVP